MMHSLPPADQIRERVNTAFAALDPERFDPAAVTETILLRDGHYYGRAYRSGDHVATLTVDPPRLRLFSSEGRLLREIALGEGRDADDAASQDAAALRRAA